MKRQWTMLTGALGFAALLCAQTNAFAQAATGSQAGRAGNGATIPGSITGALKPLPQTLTPPRQVAAPAWTGTEPAVMEEGKMAVPLRVPPATFRALSASVGSGQQAWQAVQGTTYYWQRGGVSFAATELTQGNPANPSARGIRVWVNNRGSWTYRDTSFDNWGVLLPQVASTQAVHLESLSLGDIFGGLFDWAKSIGSWIKDHWPQLEAIWKDLKAILKDAKALIADVLKLSEKKSDQTGATATKAIHDTGQQGAQQQWLLSRRVAVGLYRVQGVTPETVNSTIQFVGGR